ncbi:hypothetical protein N8996_07540 [Candidatus Poseidonia alphae]|nr:hypothetical protein [Candidatus Poseidonia alphae]
MNQQFFLIVLYYSLLISRIFFGLYIFLSFSNIRYDLDDDEIILLQSLLTQEYFEDLVPKEENKYISFNSYDNVEPNTSVPYTNDYNEDDPKSINNNANMNETTQTNDTHNNIDTSNNEINNDDTSEEEFPNEDLYNSYTDDDSISNTSINSSDED